MATTPYFGPGGQAMTLGKDEDKWSDVVAEAAHIDSFKGKGSATMPVYMDANGTPQPVTSYAGKAATAGTADTSKTCSGNSATATKATQDSAGQQINTTYIKGLSISGKTITYTKGDATTGTITTQDTAYTHPNSGATAGTYRSVTVNAQGHVTAGSNPTTLAGYGITDAPTKTGGGASGTWGINISGKANTAGTADTSKACSGNSATATKATQDSAGQQINSTYIKGLSVSGKTITYTKGDGATGTITIQDTAYTHPIGTVQMFAGKTIPAGWLLCNGADISRTTYSALYNVIGTTYGAGNGSTTFALPNLIDRVVQGAATAGTYKKAGLPNITGKSPTTGETPKGTDGTGAFRKYIVVSNAQYTGGSISTTDRTVASFDASLSNPIYGNSITVQPPALTMLPIIKY